MYGDNIGDVVEGKAMPDSSCYLLNDSDLAYNIWDALI